jgi:hypothetical protein
MPVPYRKTPRAAEVGQAAYLDILWLPSDRAFYGGLLIIDGKGQPQEFVHNSLAAPSGLLWPEPKVQDMGIAMLAHSLFDACRREPDLLVCLPFLGTPEYLKTEIAPAIPFVQVTPPRDGLPAEWNWVNDPPSSGMRASRMAQELARRGFIVEPFERLRHALRLVYPQASWLELDDDGL